MSYLEAAFALAGCSGYSLNECRLTTQSSGGRLLREASIAKSDFFDRPMESGVADRLLGAVEARGTTPSLSGQEGAFSWTHREARSPKRQRTPPPFRIARLGSWRKSS
jgi:hypothetical protein